MSNLTTIYINSKDRSTGTSTQFNYLLPLGVNDASSFYIKNVSIPSSSYVSIYPSSDGAPILFVLSDPSGLHNVSVTAGNYSASALATLLQSALNVAVGSVDYTVSYDINTYRYTISNNSSSNFTLFWDQVNQRNGQKVFLTYGFAGRLDGASSYTSTQVASASGTSYNYYIKSQAFTLDKSYSYFQDKKDSVILSVPINVGPSGLIQYNDNLGRPIQLIKSNINSLDIALYDDYNNLVDLNGLEWTLTVVLVN